MRSGTASRLTAAGWVFSVALLAPAELVWAQLAPLITESDSGVRTLKFSTYAGTWAAPGANGVTAGFKVRSRWVLSTGKWR